MTPTLNKLIIKPVAISFEKDEPNRLQNPNLISP